MSFLWREYRRGRLTEPSLSLKMNKKEVREFWQRRKKARIELDKKRNKKEDAKKLRSDREFLKTGRLV